MRFHTVALLTGATAAAAGQTATLLLPGFQGRTLEAGIISKVCIIVRVAIESSIFEHLREAFKTYR
jgi:hypothetical protein